MSNDTRAIEIGPDTFVLPPGGVPRRIGYMIQQDLGIDGPQRVYVGRADADALIVALGGVPLSAVKAFDALLTEWDEGSEDSTMDDNDDLAFIDTNAGRISSLLDMLAIARKSALIEGNKR